MWERSLGAGGEVPRVLGGSLGKVGQGSGALPGHEAGRLLVAEAVPDLV